MKKGQKRFAVGTLVKFKIWQGGVFEFIGEVVRDGKPLVWVNSFGRPFQIRREALTVIEEGGK